MMCHMGSNHSGGAHLPFNMLYSGTGASPGHLLAFLLPELFAILFKNGGIDDGKEFA